MTSQEGPDLKINPFRLERWLLKKAEIDLGGGGVTKLSLGDIVSEFDYKQLMKYGRTDGSSFIKERVAEWFPGIEPGNILITSGTSEANLILNLTLIDKGDHYLSENPQYEQTTGFVRSLGAKIELFQLKEENWSIDSEGLKKKATKNTKIIFLDNPNNPTGAKLKQDELKAICDIAEENNSYIHCDNALRGSELDGKPALTPFPMYDKGVITGSISKLGATSPRIGWIIGDKELIQRCWVMKDYTTLGHSAMGEYIAESILNKRDKIIKRNLAISKGNLEILSQWLKENEDHFKMIPPEAGFTGFPHYTDQTGSEEWCSKLLEKKDILLSPGIFFGLENYFRINVGSKPEILKEGLKRIKGFILGNN